MIGYVLLLAGCLEDGGSENRGKPLEAWPVGTWWAYELQGDLPASWMEVPHFGDADTPAGQNVRIRVESLNATFVATVEEEKALNPDLLSHIPRQVLTDDPEAGFLVRFGLPFADLWSVQRSNLSTFDGGPFFPLPMEHGKEWTMEYAGASLDVSISEIDGETTVKALAGTGDLRLRYTYDSKARWFGEYAVFDGDEDPIFTARLTESGTGYNGDGLALVTTQGALCEGINNDPMLGPGFCEVGTTVPSTGISSWWFDLSYKSPSGLVAGMKSTPRDPTYSSWFNDSCPCDEHLQTVEFAEEQGPYEWRLTHGFWGDWSLTFFHIDRCFANVPVKDGWTEANPFQTGQCLS